MKMKLAQIKTNIVQANHWCKSQFLGYEDDPNTYYIVPDIHGSTKVIFTHAGTIVNRLDYDTLGKIRNQDAAPQVELLWNNKSFNTSLDLYFSINNEIYDPILGFAFDNSRNLDEKFVNGKVIPIPGFDYDGSGVGSLETVPEVVIITIGAAAIAFGVACGIYLSRRRICLREEPVWGERPDGSRYVIRWECVEWGWSGQNS